MKVRNGFVSNSSSSSFCILGVTSSDIEKQIDVNKLRNKSENDDDDYEDIDWYEFNDKDLSVYYGISDYYEEYVLGFTMDMLKEKETIEENKNLVAQKLNEKFGTTFTKEDIKFHIDGGYEG